MNRVILSGYIASPIELRSTTNGTPVLTFQIAVRRPKQAEKITDYFTVVCWKNNAEFVSKYFEKGSGTGEPRASS